MNSIIKLAFFLAIFGSANGFHSIDNKDVFGTATATQTKGIASILILIGHCTVYIDNQLIKLINVGFLCVAIFFFWSGFGIAYGYLTKKNYIQSFWNSRLPNIMVPFLLAHVIYSAAFTLTGRKIQIPELFASLLGQCTVVSYSWYPIAVLAFYFAFWCIYSGHFKEKQKLAMLLLSTVIITIVEIWVLSIAKDWWFISNLAFFLGAAIAVLKPKETQIIRIGIVSFLISVLAVALIPGYKWIHGEYSTAVYIFSSNVTSGFIALSAIILFGLRKKENAVFSYLGKISYEIYLLHGLAIQTVSAMGITSVLMIPVVILLTMISASVFHCINNFFIAKCVRK